MYQNLSTTSEAEIAFRQAIDNVGDAEQREQLRQAYIQVEARMEAEPLYSFAQNGSGRFLRAAVELGQAALVKFFLTEYDWERWFGALPQIVSSVIVNGNLELLGWLLNESLDRVRSQCWLGVSFDDMVKIAITNAQPAVIKYLYETCEQEWQKDYINNGDSWLITAIKMKQLEIVQFLLTRDNAEQMMSNMKFWVYCNPIIEIESKALARTVKTMAQACIKNKNEELFNIFIGKVQKYIATKPQEKRPELQDLVRQVQEQFTASIVLSKLQHQRTSMADTIAKKQKYQAEQAKKCEQLEQKIVQQAPAAGLIDAASEALEIKIATYNPVKK